ncbi:MAG: molybdenum ABC transporter ATP-binding protein [Rudaea sp.]
MTAQVRIRVALEYPPFALDVDLVLPGRGITGVFGPSGAGKTVFLRAIAGLERTARGHVEVNGQVWHSDAKFLPPHRRALGYVFQESSLFPHLSVRGNLEYAASRAGCTGGALENTADLLGVSSLLPRGPASLSGGERQRVAIARALLSQPQLLLFDEPLAALDQTSRNEILPYLEQLHDQLHIPSLYVTHAAAEIARLADHVVLLDKGRVVASGPMQNTLARLDLPAPFSDTATAVIEAPVAGYNAGDRLARLRFGGGMIHVPYATAPTRERVRCRIDARDVSIALAQQTDTSILNIVPAHVVGMTRMQATAQVMVSLDAGGTPLLARITQRSWDVLRLAPGKAVWAQIKAVALD